MLVYLGCAALHRTMVNLCFVYFYPSLTSRSYDRLTLHMGPMRISHLTVPADSAAGQLSARQNIELSIEDGRVIRQYNGRSSGILASRVTL